jgi:uncharacterized protein YceK
MYDKRNWPQNALSIILFSTCILSSGCMTLVSQEVYWQPSSEAAVVLYAPDLYIYGGVVNDILYLSNNFNERDENIFFLVLLLIDIPFSAGADTVILPLTIFEQIIGSRYDNYP